MIRSTTKLRHLTIKPPTPALLLTTPHPSTTHRLSWASSAALTLARRTISTSVPYSPLNSVPSPAEHVGHPAISSKSKIWESVDEAVEVIKSGDTILSAGFGLCGTAESIIQAIGRRKDVRDLTGVSNNAGDGVYGLGEWVYACETRGCEAIDTRNDGRKTRKGLRV
jgi:hypothetical protein